MTAGEWLLALDTATNTIVVAAGTTAGDLIDADTLEGRYRHSQELLPAVVRLVDRAGLRLPDLAAIVVGTGPGAFTGLRVGLATAKTLAHELGRPVIGIGTGEALLAGADGAAALWLPAGVRDRVLVQPGSEPRVVHGSEDPGATAGVEAAIDLEGRASAEALELGRRALAALPASLLRLGAARLAAGDIDDPERLVPRYASPPRGAPAPAADEIVAWSRDPR
ncbi:MAG TPA: tRNA (adenosine(37)-N6)-threonylcarbamoyltransferase complex dimerization subunit type 1 TsaB [Candidatus Limnocylindria bacterium]|nr:tRNA (adenosine(37)-N6)-threonylcarbamoyltransferase complex dimerization subunit type 1 TsaB [Candidatus Limnocylindria bacterium]